MQNSKKYLLLGTAACLIVGAIVFGRSLDFTKPELTESVQAAQEKIEGKIEFFPDDLIIGYEHNDAKVNIIEYASFTCPHCADFHTKIGSKLKEKYKDKSVRFIYRDYPLDRFALQATLIARCDEKKRKAFIDMFFAKQSTWTKGHGQEITDNLKVMGRMGGLSDKEMEACLHNEEASRKVAAQRQYANDKFNIQATPTIIINGQEIIGEEDVNKFIEIIDKELAKPDAE